MPLETRLNDFPPIFIENDSINDQKINLLMILQIFWSRGPLALAPWALGPGPWDPWALGPMGRGPLGPWALGPRAHGPRVCLC